MTIATPAPDVASTAVTTSALDATPIRAGVVKYLNARPLVTGLWEIAGWTLHAAAPSALIGLLEDDVVDVALCSSIDLLNASFDPAWLPVGPLATLGDTKTVRLFSRRPIEELASIHVDPDSHTSVMLLRVLLADYWNAAPALTAWTGSEAPEAQLLIGDKVVDPRWSEEAWPIQIDLGEVWRAHTGLPFVFAVWMGRATNATIIQRAGRVLDRQLRLNAHRLDQVIAGSAESLGWSPDAAADYLSCNIHFQFDQDVHRGLEHFLGRCRALGLAPDRPTPAPLDI